MCLCFLFSFLIVYDFISQKFLLPVRSSSALARPQGSAGKATPRRPAAGHTDTLEVFTFGKPESHALLKTVKSRQIPTQEAQLGPPGDSNADQGGDL